MLKRILPALLLALFVSVAAVASIPPLRTMKIGKFPQRWSTQFTAADGLPSNDVRAVAFCGGRAAAGTSQGLAIYDGKKWTVLRQADGLLNDNVNVLACNEGGLMVGTAAGLQHYDLKTGAWKTLTHAVAITALTRRSGLWYAGTTIGVLVIDGKNEPQPLDAYGSRHVTALATGPRGLLWIGSKNGLSRMADDRIETLTHDDGLLADDVRALYNDPEGNVWVATAKGLNRISAKGECLAVTGKLGGLPYEDASALAMSNKDLWVGTTIGLARREGAVWHYFEGQRYIPGDNVRSIAVDPAGPVWVATDGGVAKLEYLMMTLEEKAAFFEKRIRERHNRYGQIADSNLRNSRDLSTTVLMSSDNDGLWTSIYIAAECYRYAVTKDPEAKRFARESFNALLRLETITGIPGFMARSFATATEDVGWGGEWDHLTPDGKWKWKGDTSSDEVVGHYFGHAVYFDLCADEKEKQESRAAVTTMSDYIIDNGYYLLDTDGQPTSFGKWSPEFFRSTGVYSRGLNSLEILNHLLAAHHITGNPKYRSEYERLGFKKNYFRYALKQKLNYPGFINHSDDELAFLSYFPSMLYDTDPRSRRFLKESLQRSWFIERPERNPLWNFIYGVAMPKSEFDLPNAVFTLARYPLDLRTWAIRNSHRKDIVISQTPDRFNEAEAPPPPLPPDERRVMRWNNNPYALDEGGNGANEDDGAAYLLPYWMGRYYGFIVEEESKKK